MALDISWRKSEVLCNFSSPVLPHVLRWWEGQTELPDGRSLGQAIKVLGFSLCGSDRQFICSIPGQAPLMVTAWRSTQLLLLWRHSPSPDHFPRGPSYSSCSSSKATPIFGSSPLLQVLPIYFPSFRDFSLSSPQEIASILSYFPALLETLSITGMNGRQEHGLSLP